MQPRGRDSYKNTRRLGDLFMNKNEEKKGNKGRKGRVIIHIYCGYIVVSGYIQFIVQMLFSWKRVTENLITRCFC